MFCCTLDVLLWLLLSLLTNSRIHCKCSRYLTSYGRVSCIGYGALNHHLGGWILNWKWGSTKLFAAESFMIVAFEADATVSGTCLICVETVSNMTPCVVQL